MSKITTFITFDGHGKEAIDLYTAIFKNSKILSVMTHPETGTLLHATFTLDGQHFMAMDGGEHFTFTDGFSLFIDCKTQEEIDYYWEKLTADGGAPGKCGWLKDKFGVSWQVVPEALGQLMTDPNPTKAQSVMEAMLKMGKINIAGLQAAYDNA
jgi:predicted 3-demethylubiquinone-9 3-methyltransferase (glyoxalase superfamily)